MVDMDQQLVSRLNRWKDSLEK